MADIGIKIGLEGVSQYNGDLSSIEKKTKLATNRMGKSFGQLADEIPLVGQAIRLLSNPIVAVVAAISGAGIAVVSFIDKAAGAEKVKASFEVLTGSIEVAESTLKSLAKFAASTPFQLPRIQDSARKLLAFGTAADDVTGVLKRIGDVSAGVDAPLNELSEIYGKIQVQGRVFAEDINQLT